MKCKQQFFIALFDVLSSQLMTIGDILFVIFVVQLITRFEVTESYPFIGTRGYMLILLIYLLALACHLQSARLRKK